MRLQRRMGHQERLVVDGLYYRGHVTALHGIILAPDGASNANGIKLVFN